MLNDFESKAYLLVPARYAEGSAPLIFLVTGPPGVGKSTVVSRVILRLKSAGVIIGGCTTQERRSKGARTGFAITDLTDGRTGVLATVASRLGPKVGRYKVNLTDLAGVGAASVEKAAKSSEVVVIDEVGPMELVSPEFRRAVRNAIGSGKPLVVVAHERLDDDLLNDLRRDAAETFEVSLENREESADSLAELVLRAAGGTKLT